MIVRYMLRAYIEHPVGVIQDSASLKESLQALRGQSTLARSGEKASVSFC